MAKTVKRGEQATFDFSRVGRDWSTRFRNSIVQASQAAEDLDRPLLARPPKALDEDAEDDEVERYNAALQKYEDAVNAHYERRAEAKEILNVTAPQAQAMLLAEVLASVPRGWLRTDAPEAIDWSKVASLDYITPPGYGELLNMIISGEAMSMVKESAKN